MLPCEMARYIAVFWREARKYGRFWGAEASKRASKPRIRGSELLISESVPFHANATSGKIRRSRLSWRLRHGSHNSQSRHLPARKRSEILGSDRAGPQQSACGTRG